MTVEHSPATRAAIWGTPEAMRRLLHEGWEAAGTAAAALATEVRVFLVGTGSSYHAACFAESLLRAVGVDAWAVSAFEFTRYPRPPHVSDGIVVFSHRGTKRYSLDAVELAIANGERPLLITGQGAELPAGLNALVLETVPQETSSMHTVGLLGAVTVSAQIAIALGERTGMVAVAHALRAGLERVPDALDAMLERSGAVRVLATEVEARHARYFFAGQGPNRATAPETALKVVESSYAMAVGMELEQLIHGPLVAVEPTDLVTVIAPPGPSLERATDLLRACEQIGCATWLLGGPSETRPTYHDPLPDLPEPLTPFPALLLGQLLAYHLAGLRGTNADSFRLEHAPYEQAIKALTL